MKGLFRKVEDLFVAITFAEHGEFDEARRIVAEDTKELREELRAGAINDRTVTSSCPRVT